MSLPGGRRPVRCRRAPALRVTGGLLLTVAAVGLALTGPTGPPAAASATRAAFPPLRPTRVLVLGDSVMKGADARYAGALPGRDLVVDTEVNRTTGAGADVVARIGTDWDVVVVLLGHNDGGSPGVYQPSARRLLDQLRGVRRVVWLTIHEVRPYYPDVNRFIDSLRAEYPNLSTADWNAVANAHPEAVARDGLHLTAAGATLMADLVAEQVEVGEWLWAADLHRLAARATTTTTAPPTTTSTTEVAPTSTTTSTTEAAPTSTTTPRPTTAPDATAGESTTGTTELIADPRTGAPTPDDGVGELATLAVSALGAVAGATFLVRRRRRAHRDP